MENKVKKTRLHAWHVDRGANMAQFGEYDMPLWYPSGAKQEHLVVLNSAGIFDTSHMCTVLRSGSRCPGFAAALFYKKPGGLSGKKGNFPGPRQKRLRRISDPGGRSYRRRHRFSNRPERLHGDRQCRNGRAHCGPSRRKPAPKG